MLNTIRKESNIFFTCCATLIVHFSKFARSSVVDRVSILDKLTDSLANFGLVGTKQVNFALNAEVVASGHAWLSVLTFANQEGERRVGTFNGLIVVADERSTSITCQFLCGLRLTSCQHLLRWIGT